MYDFADQVERLRNTVRLAHELADRFAEQAERGRDLARQSRQRRHAVPDWYDQDEAPHRIREEGGDR
jgi:hypothetical protein